MTILPVVKVFLSVRVEEALLKVVLFFNQLLGFVVKQVAVDCKLNRTSMVVKRINDTTSCKLSFKKSNLGFKQKLSNYIVKGSFQGVLKVNNPGLIAWFSVSIPRFKAWLIETTSSLVFVL